LSGELQKEEVDAQPYMETLLDSHLADGGRVERAFTTSPVRAALSVVAGKWKPLIIEALSGESLRFGVLLRRIPKASRKVLTDHLRDLEREKIVARAVLGKKSEHVEYSLSPYGKTLVPVLAVLAQWGERHLKTLDREP
jgi:DNA-binding HxlR family transcriptional regulator